MDETEMFQIREVYKILQHRMQFDRGLTQKESIEMFGAYRLSGIIFVLRKRLANTPYNIISVWHTGTNRYGKKSRYVEYKLVRV